MLFVLQRMPPKVYHRGADGRNPSTKGVRKPCAESVPSQLGIGYPVRARTAQKEILVEGTQEHFPNPPDSAGDPGWRDAGGNGA